MTAGRAARTPATATTLTVNGDASDTNCVPTQCLSTQEVTTSTQPSLSLNANAGASVYSGYADLATGKLGAHASAAANVIVDGAFLNPESVAEAVSTLDETIHVEGTVTTPVTAFFTVTLHGILNPGEELPFSNEPSAAATIQVGSNAFTTPFSQYDFETRGCPIGGVIGDQSCINTNAIDWRISEPFLISTTNEAIRFDIQLLAEAFDGGNADLSHTVGLSLSLPEGLTFTSDSGVFLTQAPVPEPSSALMLAIGVLCVVTRASKKR